MKILACYNMKGGVGKTTACVNLAHRASLEGLRTLLWDLDPQGAATWHLGVEPAREAGLKKLIKKKGLLDDMLRPSPYPGLHVIPAGFEYRHLDALLDDDPKKSKKLGKTLRAFEDAYDVLFLDCPPSISALSEAVFHIADHVLMPLVPLELSRMTYERVGRYLAEELSCPVDVVPFFNMADKRRVVHRRVMKELRAGGRFCEQAIPRRADLERMGVERRPVAAFAPDSDSALAFMLLFREIASRCGLGGR
jgi:cellulose biosynthesis protein BcsQ